MARTPDERVEVNALLAQAERELAAERAALAEAVTAAVAQFGPSSGPLKPAHVVRIMRAANDALDALYGPNKRTPGRYEALVARQCRNARIAAWERQARTARGLIAKRDPEVIAAIDDRSAAA